MCTLGKIRYVKSTCVSDTGSRKKVLPVPVKGNLSKYGYYNVKNTYAVDRRKALLKGVKDVGYATIIRRVNLIANYNKNSNPRVHKIMKSDIAWMQKNLAAKYSKSFKKAPLIKAGTVTVGGRSRQLFHIQGSKKKFYQYRKKSGGLGRRYV